MRNLYLTLIVPALVVAACADTPPPAAPIAPIPAPPGSGLSSEGALCGDDVAIQKRCAAGLVCAIDYSHGVSEHAPGVCKRAPGGACASRARWTLCPPKACTPAQHVNDACSPGESCGNEIGDECHCVDGRFDCTPHAPLSTDPDACNLTCLR